MIGNPIEDPVDLKTIGMQDEFEAEAYYEESRQPTCTQSTSVSTSDDEDDYTEHDWQDSSNEEDSMHRHNHLRAHDMPSVVPSYSSRPVRSAVHSLLSFKQSKKLNSRKWDYEKELNSRKWDYEKEEEEPRAQTTEFVKPKKLALLPGSLKARRTLAAERNAILLREKMLSHCVKGEAAEVFRAEEDWSKARAIAMSLRAIAEQEVIDAEEGDEEKPQNLSRFSNKARF